MILGDNEVMVIGNDLSFYYDFLMEKWTPGPNLKISRHGHACGNIKVKDEPMIITVGGIDQSHNLLKSIELMGNGKSQWELGPSLVKAMCHMAIVSYENFAIMLGGSTDQEEQAGYFIYCNLLKQVRLIWYDLTFEAQCCRAYKAQYVLTCSLFDQIHSI